VHTRRPPRIWNQLPTEINDATETVAFKRKLKTYLFRPWCHTFPSVLLRPAADHWEPSTLPASVCWQLTDLRFLSSTCIPEAVITHLNVHWSCRWVDAFKWHPTKCCEDWDPLAATSHRLHQLLQASLWVGTNFVTPSAAVQDLRIHLDSDMSMRSHVRKTVSICFAELRQLHSIRRSVSRPVVQSLVLSRLDYGNVTLAGITQHLLRLESVMNAAARLIYSLSRFNHITPLLRQLHWL